MAASFKEISNILGALSKQENSLEAMALATVVEVEGSAYRRTGARMLILQNGQWVGTISGGCLEGNALRQAREVIMERKPRLLTYDTRKDEDAKALGASLGCNGVIQVWIEPLSEAAVSMLNALNEAYLGTEEKWFARCLEGNHAGELFAAHDPALPSGLTHEEGLQRISGQLFAVERVVPTLRLIIFGAGDDARPLCQLADQMGWRVTVTDDCQAKTLPVRFPEAEQVIHLERNGAVNKLNLTAFCGAVLMSHSYAYDKVILESLLKHDLAYLGILGPKARFERMQTELGDAWTANKTVHAPVGLDIGAQTPFEIALAIVAEIQACLSNREGGFLKDRPGSIHGRKFQPA